MTFFCTQCGTALDDDMAFCTSCGSPVQNPDEMNSSSSTHSTDTMPMAAAMAQQSQLASQVQQPAQAQQTPHNYMASQPIMGQPMQQPQQKDNKPVIIAAIAAAAVIVIALIVAFFIIGNSGGSKSSEVTFETGGGTSIAALTVDNGDTITTPTEPTRQGYTFDGWYLDKDYKQKVTFPYKVDKDTVLYAKWNEGSSGGGSAATGSSTTTPSTSESNAGSSNAVTLTCVGADGTTRTGTIHRQGNSGRVFADSNTRLLSAGEVAALSDAERCVAWNEIIAASNGYSFKNSGLRNYFLNNCSWYSPNPGASAGGILSSEASANVQLLKSYTDDWWEHLSAY